jgi:hypothetical protein
LLPQKSNVAIAILTASPFFDELNSWFNGWLQSTGGYSSELPIK